MQEETPQLEDGYTRIANELFEAILGFGFTQRQLLVLLTVLRKTYGYGKKEDDMSAGQIGQMCGVKRNHVSEVIGQLAGMNVLARRPGVYGLIVGINKNHRRWVVPNRDTLSQIGTTASSTEDEALTTMGSSPELGLVPNRDSDSPELGQVDSPKSGHTKENLLKETQKKGRAPREEMTFNAWLADCKAKGVLPIPEKDPIFAYADDQGLPIDFIRYAWLEFRRKYAGARKKYRDWNQHFGNAVRENWYGIWFEKDGEFALTTRGKQVKREHRNEE